MHHRKSTHCAWQTILLLTALASLPASRLVAADHVDFNADIAPLLTKYCAGCHNAEDKEGELSLESFADIRKGGAEGPVIQPGESASSRMIQVLTGQAEPAMPPDDEPAPSAEEIALLRAWIDSGAVGPQTEQSPPRLATPQIPASLAPKPITSVAYSPAGDLLAIARYQQVELRTADGLRFVRHFGDHPGKVNRVGFMPDGWHLIVAGGTAGQSGDVRMWDIRSGELLKRFRGHRDLIYAAVPSPDGQVLATASYDQQIILWDMDSGAEVRTLSGHNGPVYDLAFSPDGQLLASASADTTVKIWQVATGKRLDTLSQPLKEQYSVDISPDGEFVIAGGEDNRIRKWRLISRDEARINPLLIARFAHEHGIYGVRYSLDGQRIVSLGADETVKVWDADQLQQLQVFAEQSDSVQALAISPNHRITVGRMDGSLQSYDLHQPPAARIDAGEPTVGPTPPATTAWDLAEFAEAEPNDQVTTAQAIELPARIDGTIDSHRAGQSDVDHFRFSASAGQQLILEIDAARSGSALDSRISIFTTDGNPVPRVQLQAVRDAYFTFRGKDSEQTGDFRLHNWQEMRLNQLLYASGEVVKLYHYPRGPDSGFNVYPNFGSRHGLFDTTPIAHALHEPCYIVEAHPPGELLAANGLPVFMLNYENDDDSLRSLGKDSRLTFVAPEAADYVVRVEDVRGFSGADFTYQLAIRPPRPDFDVRIADINLKVPQLGGTKFGVQLDRHDGFAGPVQLDIQGLPTGFQVTTPIVIEAGQLRAWGTVTAAADAEQPSEADPECTIVATAEIAGQRVQKPVGSLGQFKLEPARKIRPQLVPDTPSAADDSSAESAVIEIPAGTTSTARVRIERSGFDDRVAFGNEEAVFNAPHGVYVDNIGLNGVLIPEGETERVIYLTVEPWVKPCERWVFVEAQAEQNPTSAPVRLRITSPASQP